MRRIEGLTLFELLMVIVILGILAAFVAPVLYNAVRAYDGVQESTNTNAKLRYAMERIARELRDIRRQATDSAYPDIASMGRASLAFFKSNGTLVALSGPGSGVTLAYAGSSGLLIDQVQAGSFSIAYFQQNLATAVTITAAASTTTQRVAFVQFAMSIVEGNHAFPARMRIDLRNPQ